MKGRGVLTLNQETMEQALQEWIEKRWTADPVVVLHVGPHSPDNGLTYNTRGDAQRLFDVKIMAAKDFVLNPEK